MKSEASRAITTPTLDLICIGGASIIALVWVLLAEVPVDLPVTGLPMAATVLLGLQILLNYPHFMASYRLLYQRPELVKRHRWASTYVPLLLLGYVIFIFFCARATGEGVVPYYLIIDYVASCYLAVHYAGQAWGMMASMGYLTGFPISKRDRQILRGVLKLFLAWHVASYHQLAPFAWKSLFPQLSSIVPYAWQITTYLAHAGMAIAAIWFVVMSRRQGRAVPMRVWVPLVALYLGYVTYQRGHIGGLFLLQIGHSLQYLIFPMRVEANRAMEQGTTGKTALLKHMLIYGALLFVVGWITFIASGHLQPADWGVASMTFIAGVNIHHYFTDGVVWKISTPEVKKDLFRHVLANKQPAADANTPQPTRPTSKKKRQRKAGERRGQPLQPT